MFAERGFIFLIRTKLKGWFYVLNQSLEEWDDLTAANGFVVANNTAYNNNLDPYDNVTMRGDCPTGDASANRHHYEPKLLRDQCGRQAAARYLRCDRSKRIPWYQKSGNG
jgi:hypothetical protein